MSLFIGNDQHSNIILVTSLFFPHNLSISTCCADGLVKVSN